MNSQLMIKKEDRDPITEKIIHCCFNVHSELGPGLNEKIYHNALRLVFAEEGLAHETEKQYKLNYKGHIVGWFRLDMIVEDKVIVEVKAFTGRMPAVFKNQVIAYLKVAGLHVGLLVNFGNRSCEIKRFIHE